MPVTFGERQISDSSCGRISQSFPTVTVLCAGDYEVVARLFRYIALSYVSEKIEQEIKMSLK